MLLSFVRLVLFMAIRIIITGGTIDGLEYSSANKAPPRHLSIIPEFLERARLSIEYELELLMQKDSKFITDGDREFIFDRCLKSKEKQIVITHGTMTMPLTAKFLGKKKLKKTIVLVGSAVLGNKTNSDAFFNLGGAIIAVQLLPVGVYVAMDGKIFTWNNVKKNFKTGMFEPER